MPRDKGSHLVEPEWVRIFFHIDIPFVPISVDHTVIFDGLLHREVTGDQWVIRPVEQAGGQAILLTQRQPVPIAGWDEIQKTQGAFLEKPQNLLLIRSPGSDRFWGNNATDLWDEGIAEGLHPAIDDRPCVVLLNDLVQLAEGLDLNFFHVDRRWTLGSRTPFRNIQPSSRYNSGYR